MTDMEDRGKTATEKHRANLAKIALEARIDRLEEAVRALQDQVRSILATIPKEK